jgi:hypothetical protein
LARFSPALTRVRIIERSNSANAPVIWNMSLPAGVVVSSGLLIEVQVGATDSKRASHLCRTIRARAERSPKIFDWKWSDFFALVPTSVEK